MGHFFYVFVSSKCKSILGKQLVGSFARVYGHCIYYKYHILLTFHLRSGWTQQLVENVEASLFFRLSHSSGLLQQVLKSRLRNLTTFVSYLYVYLEILIFNWSQMMLTAFGRVTWDQSLNIKKWYVKLSKCLGGSEKSDPETWRGTHLEPQAWKIIDTLQFGMQEIAAVGGSKGPSIMKVQVCLLYTYSSASPSPEEGGGAYRLMGMLPDLLEHRGRGK